MSSTSKQYPPFAPLVAVVGFHHHRGPEIESWFGVPAGVDPAVDNDWSFLPFMALADGAHASTEDFSYFTLRRKPAGRSPSLDDGSGQPSPLLAPAESSGNTPDGSGTPTGSAPKMSRTSSRVRYGAGASVFAMSCTRQLKSDELLVRPSDVTRSTVQKSVVVLVGSRPGRFAGWREKLGAVTRSWFMQRDFDDREILKHFQESLVESERSYEDEPDHFLGISLRQFIYDFRHQALVLFKCALLQPKMLFFGTKTEKICMIQFALISLIPGLIRHLEDCADPELDTFAQSASTPTSLRTSDRNSLLEYMGLPLQIFGKGGFFGPYTPLQQLDLLMDPATQSYVVGSTNTLLLQRKEGGPEVVVEVDDKTITVYDQTLRQVLNLSPADRRWIDSIHQTIISTWDPENPTQPTTHSYLGSEDFIRYQFEEYVLALLAATKYQSYFHAIPPKRRDLSAFPEIEGDPTTDFHDAWVERWKQTPSFALWNRYTDSHLFDIVEPRHPTAGGLSVDDIQRRFAQQITDLHLDSRVAAGREALGKHLATGQKKVSTAFSSLWTELEARREAQKERWGNRSGTLSPPPDDGGSSTTAAAASPYMEAAAVKASQAGAVAAAAGQRASAYLSGWGTWASEKRKGWGRNSSTTDLREIAARESGGGRSSEQRVRSPSPAPKSAGLWGVGWGGAKNEKNLTVSTSVDGASEVSTAEKSYSEVITPDGGNETIWDHRTASRGVHVGSPASNNEKTGSGSGIGSPLGSPPGRMATSPPGRMPMAMATSPPGSGSGGTGGSGGMGGTSGTGGTGGTGTRRSLTKRMSGRFGGPKSPKSRERIIDGIGRIDAP